MASAELAEVVIKQEESNVVEEPRTQEEVTSNVILVSEENPVNLQPTVPQDAEDEVTDDDWDSALVDAHLEVDYPDGRCFEEGELELDDDFGEDGELVLDLAVFQYDDKDADAEEGELVESSAIKLKKLATGKTEQCYMCGCQFVSQRSLQNHMKVHAEEGIKVTCRFCHRTCPSREDYREHIKNHDNDCLFMCSECGKAFHTKNYLDLHARSHQGKHQCPKCPMRFEQNVRLVKHLKYHGISNTGLWETNQKRPSRIPKGKPQYRCEMCDKLYITLGAFKKHKFVAHQEGYKCDICDLPFPSFTPLREHIAKEHKAGSAMCQYCGKTFNDPWYLKRHEMIHTNTPALTCEICNASFAAIGHYIRHARIHTGEKPFVCSYCGKSFAENGTLTRHERTHTGQRPFSCKLCDKSFTVSHAMKRHMRTHDLVKGYPCKLCSAAYYTDRSLERHMKQKHPDLDSSSIELLTSTRAEEQSTHHQFTQPAEVVVTQGSEEHQAVVEIISTEMVGQPMPQEVHVVSSIEHWETPDQNTVEVRQQDSDLNQVSDDLIKMEFERRFGKKTQSPRRKHHKKERQLEQHHSPMASSSSSPSSESEWGED